MDIKSNYINICLVGCVSAGKSTILNAFFGKDYTQCKIKRTTMMPNVFIETDDYTQIDNIEYINNKISEINKQIYLQTEDSKKKFQLEDFGNELIFHVESMDLNIGNKIKICIYDIPGLNDGRTKNVYYEYLRKNFHNYNIILFVVDIMQGLNTSDEMDILNFLTENIKIHKINFNKNINMITIVNKADDMHLQNDKLEVLGELGEMFEQTSKIVKQAFNKNGIDSNLIDCIPICGLDAHLYRMIKKHKDINKLSREHILRIGINDEGSKFRGFSEILQRNKVQEIIKNNSFVDNMIKLSGFSQIENCLIKKIEINGKNMVKENILWEYQKIEEMNINNLIVVLEKKIKILLFLIDIQPQEYINEMKKVVKQVNTIIYKKINGMTNVNDIKVFFDNEFIQKIKSNILIKNNFSKFYNLEIYPNYFIDKILDIVVQEFSNGSVSVYKLDYIELFYKMNYLKLEVIDVILDSLMSNKLGLKSLKFDNAFNVEIEKKMIRIFEKIKISEKFIVFLRFFLANIFNSFYKEEELIYKKMFFELYDEIPMSNFIQNLINKKTQNDIPFKIYCQGLTDKTQKDNLIELYYVAKSREMNDTNNFKSHEKKITIDFNTIF